MEQSQSKKLDDLPKSNDDYWKLSDVELRKIEVSKPHEHKFMQITSREIKCDCGFGLFIGEGDSVKDGHLYHLGEFII